MTLMEQATRRAQWFKTHMDFKDYDGDLSALPVPRENAKPLIALNNYVMDSVYVFASLDGDLCVYEIAGDLVRG